MFRNPTSFLVQILLVVLFISFGSFAEAKPPQKKGQILKTKNGEVSLFFGMSLKEAEKVLGKKAVEDKDDLVASTFLSRAVDMKISTTDLILTFHSGRLYKIKYTSSFNNSVNPFEKDLMNPPAGEDLKVALKMKLQDFRKIAQKWKNSLIKSGYREVPYGKKMREKEFSMVYEKTEFLNEFHITFGPSRQTSDGKLFHDGWHFSFSTKLHAFYGFKKVDLLYSISAFDDTYNTRGRSQTK